MPRVNGRPEQWNNTPFAIEVGPAVGGDGLVVLGQGTEETIEILKPEPSAMHLMQGGQGVTVVADIELREYREGFAVKHTARM